MYFFGLNYSHVVLCILFELCCIICGVLYCFELYAYFAVFCVICVTRGVGIGAWKVMAL